MNSKYKFGSTEVIAMIVGSLIIVILDLILRENSIDYADTIKSTMVVIFAAVFGSPAGVVVALASSLLLAAILKLDVSVIVVMAYILIALMVGHYSQDYGIRDGLFFGKKILIFSLVKLMAEIFSWLIFLPMLELLIKRANLYDLLGAKIKSVLMLTVVDIIIIPAFILISCLISKRINKNGLQQL